MRRALIIIMRIGQINGNSAKFSHFEGVVQAADKAIHAIWRMRDGIKS